MVNDQQIKQAGKSYAPAVQGDSKPIFNSKKFYFLGLPCLYINAVYRKQRNRGNEEIKEIDAMLNAIPSGRLSDSLAASLLVELMLCRTLTAFGEGRGICI